MTQPIYAPRPAVQAVKPTKRPAKPKTREVNYKRGSVARHALGGEHAAHHRDRQEEPKTK